MYCISRYGLLCSIDIKTCRQIRLDFYLFSSEWKGLSFSLHKKYAIIFMITLMGEIDLGCYCLGCTFCICLNTDGNISWFLNYLRCICLGRNLKDGCVFKEGYRDYQHLAVGKTITYRQIKPDAYLFSREWMCFNTLTSRDYNVSCTNTLDGELVMWTSYYGCYLSLCNMMYDNLLLPVIALKFRLSIHSCEVHKLIEQYDENWGGSSQKHMDNLDPHYTFKAFYKILSIRAVASRQIELDFYWFSRVWNGLNSPSYMEYEMSLMFRDYSLNHLISLSFWDELLVFSLLLCWTYPAARPLSQLSPTGAWPVSTYVWDSSKMKPVFDHKCFGWKFSSLGFLFGRVSRNFSLCSFFPISFLALFCLEGTGLGSPLLVILFFGRVMHLCMSRVAHL